ncbi:cupin domain-containing protein [Georgenia faecalis]|uniref:Cupin domain-containing protein n=1 Tax=Georgenia faecalis TaxID=2483799 RepID=A0ABV9DA28_9MICO|nr:cupin domain-containing protein [Georgenia faecalis]
MRVVTLPRRRIEAFASSGVVMDFLPTVTGGRTGVRLARIDAGGTLGRHRAPTRQMFAVVEGTGVVSTTGYPDVVVGVGQAVLWEPGEDHETRAGTAMLVAVVELDGDLELGPEHVLGEVPGPS